MPSHRVPQESDSPPTSRSGSDPHTPSSPRPWTHPLEGHSLPFPVDHDPRKNRRRHQDRHLTTAHPKARSTTADVGGDQRTGTGLTQSYTSGVGEIISIAALVLILAAAVIRPCGWPEATFAVPAAAIVLATRSLSLDDAWIEIQRLFPVVAFLAAVLVISELCDVDGLFRYAGAMIASRSRGSAQRLLVQVFILASVVTAVLSLDATVVLLTPVVLATTSRMGLRPRPHVYACTHLANASSLLLPVSNLTNLLAMSAAGLSFVGFAGLMGLPWLAVILVEYVAFRFFFAADLSLTATNDDSPEQVRAPWFSVTVLGLTLVGFVAASFLHVDAAWAALAGALVLLIRGLIRRQVQAREIPGLISFGFLAFVLSLGVVVQAVVKGGFGEAVGAVVPHGSNLGVLLLWAFLAAGLANAVNNLPAVLVLLPFATPWGAGPVLAVLIGVNVGPNLTFVGSLATLLWRRIIRDNGPETTIREFTLLGLLTTPIAIVVGVVSLWASLRIGGMA